jgi:hypothetical protein
VFQTLQAKAVEKIMHKKVKLDSTQQSLPGFCSMKSCTIKKCKISTRLGDVSLQKKGFYVEVGGFDGEHVSNNIWFEKIYGWTGLLIEADPSLYLQLRGKNRHCVTANACVSPTASPTTVRLRTIHTAN